MNDFESLFEALNEAEVRYVVVGGLAVVLHGYARLTGDVDLIVDLVPKEAAKAIKALLGSGFKPKPPVDALQFSDPDVRQSWVDEKGMRVFSLFDPKRPMLLLDLFVENPIPFEELWGRSEILPLSGVSVRVASIKDIIRLKKKAGRPQDLQDIEALRKIQRRNSDG